jgi:hypothetical protein
MVTVMSDAGATMSEMDAGRFAVSELAALAIESSEGAGRLSLTIRPEPHAIELAAQTTASCLPVEASQFVADLLDALTLRWTASTSGRFEFKAAVPVRDAPASDL